jgi:serine/threonine protein kinase/tetratricopeptide (TPR) repeat protein
MNEEEIFHQALARAVPEERSAYLEHACAGNPALRASVEALLRANVGASGFMEGPACGPVVTVDQPITERPGTVIGPYKLMEQIGEGGMGLVFVAEQQQPVRRKVALKLIKPGLDTREVIARFEAERQALALMDHPNIAKVFDGGTTGVASASGEWREKDKGAAALATHHSPLATTSGRPYFVMELVKGVPITDYCDENRLTPRERLGLFLDVCQAVQHAHQKGIIHRDLKPSNVLVTLHDGIPVVKVIDFGVAKAIGQQLTEKTIYTRFTQMIGTPLYMSPEQAEMSGLDVDTRTDVYALGVLLYELLTGTTPFDGERLRTVGFDEMRRIIREEEPPKPSTRISTLGLAATTVSANRKSDPRRLSQLCRGELDWVVMKALEKDRNRRYETASAFAADVQRYLHDEPVLACPPSAWYRFRKFARRNKAALVTTVVVILAGLALLAGVLWHNARLAAKVVEVEEQQRETQREAERADANFNRTLEAVDKFLSRVGHKQLEQIPGMEQVRREVLEEALQFFQGFLREKGDAPAVRREAAIAYFRVGHIQNLLGRYDPAEQAYYRGAELLTKLVAEFPARAPYRRDLVGCHTNLAMLLQTTGRIKEAEPHYRRAVELCEELARDHPADPDHQSSLARAYSDMGSYSKETGRPQEAEQFYCRAVDLQEKLAADSPAVAEYRDNLARSHLNFGLLLKTMGRPQDAESAYLRAIELYEKLAAELPARPGYRHQLTGAHLNFGVLLEDTGRRERADAAYRRALELAEQLAADFPTVPDYRSFLAKSHFNVGALLRKTGQLPEAELAYRRVLEVCEKLAAEFPRVPQYRRDLVLCLNNLGALLHEANRPGEAERALRRALDVQRDLAAAPSATPEDRIHVATGYYNLAIQLEQSEQDQEAEAAYRQARELFERLVADFPAAPDARSILGAVLNNLSKYPGSRGELAEARLLAEQAIEHQGLALKSNPRHPVYRQYLGNHYRTLAGILVLLGDHAEAAKIAVEAPRLYPDSWQECVRAAEFLARCVPLAEKDARLPDDQRRTLAQAYADQAIAWLRDAVAKGCTDAGQLTKPKAFDSLRGRADFQELVRTLEEKAERK